MGSSRSPHNDGDKVVLKNGEEVTVTDGGEFITHVQGENDRYPRPVGNDQIATEGKKRD